MVLIKFVLNYVRIKVHRLCVESDIIMYMCLPFSGKFLQSNFCKRAAFKFLQFNFSRMGNPARQ